MSWPRPTEKALPDASYAMVWVGSWEVNGLTVQASHMSMTRPVTSRGSLTN